MKHLNNKTNLTSKSNYPLDEIESNSSIDIIYDPLDSAQRKRYASQCENLINS